MGFKLKKRASGRKQRCWDCEVLYMNDIGIGEDMSIKVLGGTLEEARKHAEEFCKVYFEGKKYHIYRYSTIA